MKIIKKHEEYEYGSMWKEPESRAKDLYKEHGRKVHTKLTVLEKIPNKLFHGDLTLEYLRTKLLTSIAATLTKLQVNANHVTTFGLIIAITSLFTKNALLICMLILMNLCIDGIDGVVARFQSKNNIFGARYDIFSDTVASMIFSFVAFSLYSPNKYLLYVLILLLPIQVVLSTLKNAKLFGKPLAIGTRISSSLITLLLLLFSLTIENLELSNTLYINSLIGFMILIISINILHISIINSKKVLNTPYSSFN